MRQTTLWHPPNSEQSLFLPSSASISSFFSLRLSFVPLTAAASPAAPLAAPTTRKKPRFAVHSITSTSHALACTLCVYGAFSGLCTRLSPIVGSCLRSVTTASFLFMQSYPYQQLPSFWPQPVPKGVRYPPVSRENIKPHSLGTVQKLPYSFKNSCVISAKGR